MDGEVECVCFQTVRSGTSGSTTELRASVRGATTRYVDVTSDPRPTPPVGPLPSHTAPQVTTTTTTTSSVTALPHATLLYCFYPSDPPVYHITADIVLSQLYRLLLSAFCVNYSITLPFICWLLLLIRPKEIFQIHPRFVL